MSSPPQAAAAAAEHWWKKPMTQLIAHELRRPGFREFAVGAAVVFFGLGLNIAFSITDKDRAESPYYQDFFAKKKDAHGHGHH